QVSQDIMGAIEVRSVRRRTRVPGWSRTTSAVAMVVSAQNWRFGVVTGFDGQMMNVLCSGFQPAHSALALFVQMLTPALLRVVSLGFQKKFSADLDKLYQKRVAEGKAPARAGAAADDRKSKDQ